MKQINRTFGSLVLGLVALVAGSAAPAAASGSMTATSSSLACAHGASTSSLGTKVCNETSEPVTTQVYVESKVEVTVGSSTFNVKVGAVQGAHFTKELDPGECVAIKYTFDCCYHWWSGWTCSNTGYSLVDA